MLGGSHLIDVRIRVVVVIVIIVVFGGCCGRGRGGRGLGLDDDAAVLREGVHGSVVGGDGGLPLKGIAVAKEGLDVIAVGLDLDIVVLHEAGLEHFFQCRSVDFFDGRFGRRVHHLFILVVFRAGFVLR